jgi:pimeloyl-ACP methyl ester carboxylesterase
MAVALGEHEQTRARYPDESGYERDGVRSYYEVYGSGQPTVLLLPTWSIIHSRHWKMQIPFLARQHRVLTFDGRGNGRSDRPQDPAAYDEHEFAADARAVLDATATERAVIVGFSLGNQRGLILAANHPERVAGAVFIGPNFPGGGEPLSERTVFDFDVEYDTDEGWAKYNRFYWLREYRDFVEFFMSKIFTEPHSTKPFEDAVGWALETDGETLVAGRGLSRTRRASSPAASAAPCSSSTAPTMPSPLRRAGRRSPRRPAASSRCSRVRVTPRTCAIP